MTANGSPKPTAAERFIALEKLVAQQGERIAKLEAMLGALRTALTGGSDAGASDRELDGKYGDPRVKFIPRDWTQGGVRKGDAFSSCPPDFLELLAETFDYYATKKEGQTGADGKPANFWDKKNARLARGWARRLRSGWEPPPAPPEPAFDAPVANPFDQFASPGPNPFAATSAPADGDPFAAGWPGYGASAAPTASEPEAEDGDGTSFDFGANVNRPPPARPAPPPPPSSNASSEDDDDDLSDLALNAG